jgi:hypothetical protein
VLVAALSALALASGLHGTVLIDPARPVCPADGSCSAPDPNERLAFWRGTTKVATATTRADGTFRVALAPGTYRLTLPLQRRARFAPQSFRVRRGVNSLVKIHVDVGIR